MLTSHLTDEWINPVVFLDDGRGQVLVVFFDIFEANFDGASFGMFKLFCWFQIFDFPIFSEPEIDWYNLSLRLLTSISTDYSSRKSWKSF